MTAKPKLGETWTVLGTTINRPGFFSVHNSEYDENEDAGGEDDDDEKEEE